MENNDHAIGYATEADVKAALSHTDEVIEWETIGFAFHKSARACVIVRSGALGGDTREVHGGWKFANVFKMEMAWSEIRAVAEAFTPIKRVPSNLLAHATIYRKAPR